MCIERYYTKLNLLKKLQFWQHLISRNVVNEDRYFKASAESNNIAYGSRRSYKAHERIHLKIDFIRECTVNT